MQGVFVQISENFSLGRVSRGGAGRRPQRWLQDNDVFKIDIEEIDQLTNTFLSK